MANSRSDIFSDEILNVKCCFCDAENKSREAEKYCVECKDYYCSSCIETHNKFPATKDHKVMDKADFKLLGTDDSLPSRPTQRCPLHRSEVINMFCKDHNEVACSPCIAVNHRTCSDIHFITEDVTVLFNKTNLIAIRKKIRGTMKIMEDIKLAKEIKVKGLKEAFEQEVKSIGEFRQEMQTLLSNIEQDTIIELKREFDKVESILTCEIDQAQQILEAMKEANLQLVKSKGNKSQEFVSIKLSEKETEKAENMRKEHEAKSEETPHFKADMNIKSFLVQIKTLGNISNGENNIKDNLYKMKNYKVVSVNLTEDNEVCDINGSCINDNGSLLLTDKNNKKLKRLDMLTDRVKDSIKFQAAPRVVCLISKMEAVVTMDNNTLQFVSLGNTLSATRTVKLGHNCYGVAHSEGKLFITDYANALYIYNLYGQQLRRISTDGSGKQIFEGSAAHIAVDSAGERLFVSDYGWTSTSVVILDIQGNCVATLKFKPNTLLLGPHGLCSHGRNVFVGSYITDHVFQIGKEGTLLGAIAGTTGKILSLCFDSQKTRLFVTFERKNYINILELE